MRHMLIKRCSELTMIALASLVLSLGCERTAVSAAKDAETGPTTAPNIDLSKEPAVSDKVEKSDAEWKKELSPKQYEVLRKKGTERAYTGELLDIHDPGLFRCAGCGNPLFSTETKFDSGTGWPSFYQPIEKDRVAVESDTSHGMSRDEVVCARCQGHLGHVFNDGPEPTGLRYCMNSVSMKFEKTDATATTAPAKK